MANSYARFDSGEPGVFSTATEMAYASQSDADRSEGNHLRVSGSPCATCYAGSACARNGTLEEKLRELTGIEICCTDVTERKQVDRLISTALRKFAKIDMLIYATGENIPDRAMKLLTPETWDMMLAVNLTGAFNCTTAVLPAMRSAGGGLLIYISTISVHQPDVSGAAYQASKHGLSGLAHAIRVEEKLNGIRTSVVFPGLCKTDMVGKRPVPTPKEILDQALEPEDVADAVLAIASLHPRATVPEMELIPSNL